MEALRILKVKHFTKSTLSLKYFRNIVIVMTKGKNKKMKITKIYLFLLPPLPSQNGGFCCSAPSPQLFSLVWLFAINRTTIPRIYNCSELVCAIVDLGIVGLSVMCAYYWHNLFIYLCKN